MANKEQTPDEAWFKRLEDDGLLIDQMASLGWAFWPYKADGTPTGFFDEGSLRKLADEIERRNKPFWDSYNEACLRDYGHDEKGQQHFDFLLDKPVEA